MLGIQTRGRRMVGTDETTELWQPPKFTVRYYNLLLFSGAEALAVVEADVEEYEHCIEMKTLSGDSKGKPLE